LRARARASRAVVLACAFSSPPSTLILPSRDGLPNEPAGKKIASKRCILEMRNFYPLFDVQTMMVEPDWPVRRVCRP
jgi:hypothetical protein